MRKIVLVLFIIISAISNLYSQIEINEEKDVIQLSGVIRNDSLKTLPFASIAVLNTNRGAISDFWGYYSLAVYPYDTIQFSSIGYKKITIVLPENLDGKSYSNDIVLTTDTVFLSQIVVFPWRTYDQFLKAVVELDLPEDDMSRARKNIALIQEQLISDEYQADASLNYKYYMNQKYNQAYTAGQFPVVNILNPLAWAQFFEALKSGMFKSKKKVY